MDPTTSHPLEGASEHPAGDRVVGPATEELEHHARRELRGTAEAGVRVVVLRGQRRHRDVEIVGGESRSGEGDLARQVLAHARRRPAYVVGPVAPRLRHGGQHLAQRRLPAAWPVGEVGTGEERAPVMVEDDGHRPAAVAGHRDRGLHVDGVDVGPLLAVDLDADEVRVQLRRGRVVLERLVRHHVTPVAGGVPDAQEHRHSAPPRLGERLFAPLPPVDGVLRVLEEVRRGGAAEPVGHPSTLAAGGDHRTGGRSPWSARENMHEP